MHRKDWRQAKTRQLSVRDVAEKLYYSARKKASSRGLVFALDFEDVLHKVALGRCAVTGIPFDMRLKPSKWCDLPFRASLDRIDNTIGYVPTNVQVVCKIYNHAKWTWNDDDVLTMATALIGEKSC